MPAYRQPHYLVNSSEVIRVESTAPLRWRNWSSLDCISSRRAHSAPLRPCLWKMSSTRLLSALASQVSRALTHEAASTSASLSQTVSSLSLRAAAAASARWQSTVAAAAAPPPPLPTHAYSPPVNGGLLVDTLDMVRDSNLTVT